MRLIILIAFLLPAFMHAQADTAGLEKNTTAKMKWVNRHLKGNWYFVSKTCIQKNDTLVQTAIATAEVTTATTRPHTRLRFKRNGTLTVYSFPYKKIRQGYTAKWKIEVMPFTQIDLFYIVIYDAQTPGGNTEFSAFISNLDKHNLQLSDKNQCVIDFRK